MSTKDINPVTRLTNIKEDAPFSIAIDYLHSIDHLANVDVEFQIYQTDVDGAVRDLHLV